MAYHGMAKKHHWTWFSSLPFYMVMNLILGLDFSNIHMIWLENGSEKWGLLHYGLMFLIVVYILVYQLIGKLGAGKHRMGEGCWHSRRWRVPVKQRLAALIGIESTRLSQVQRCSEHCAIDFATPLALWFQSTAPKNRQTLPYIVSGPTLPYK